VIKINWNTLDLSPATMEEFVGEFMNFKTLDFFVVERYVPASNLTAFLQGILLGLSIAANIFAILLLPARLKPRN